MANNTERLNALENSQRLVHKKLDQLVTVLGNGIDPAYLPEALAAGVPVPTPEPNERASAVAVGGGGTDLATLLQLAALLRPPMPPAPVETMMDKLLPLVVPALMDKLMADRPDPIEQFAKLKELLEPAMSDQLIGAAMPALMPALIAKLSGETPKGTEGQATNTEGLADAFKTALAGLDPADLAALTAGQTGTDGKDGGS